jgi:hypothetical protein
VTVKTKPNRFIRLPHWDEIDGDNPRIQAGMLAVLRDQIEEGGLLAVWDIADRVCMPDGLARCILNRMVELELVAFVEDGVVQFGSNCVYRFDGYWAPLEINFGDNDMTVDEFLKCVRDDGGAMSFAKLRTTFPGGYHAAALVAVERKLASWETYDDGTGGIKLLEGK